ncbi:MAG: hypothetical protein J6T10_02040 [Methanobrevibacter sp.]|nr:hypothetical protein [Methanobrevibacter sp.]
MFKIGDKVYFNSKVTEEPIYGYIVKIEIDPFEEIDVKFDKENYVFYTIRVYKNFYKDGYADFNRTEREICHAKT